MLRNGMLNLYGYWTHTWTGQPGELTPFAEMQLNGSVVGGGHPGAGPEAGQHTAGTEIRCTATPGM